MQDYVNQLLLAINRYDSEDAQTVNHLRDLVCWISDDESLKKEPIIADLLYIASQKMRVFGYNILNGFLEEPVPSSSALRDLENAAIVNLYRSRVNEANILDQSQKEVIDTFQNISPRRLLVSAPTSYGKTFLMREIVFLNKERYKNILLVFPTVALLLENARMMSDFVFNNKLTYHVVKTVDAVCDDGTPQIFVFTPERALQLIASFPDIKIDFFFFDEVYKIDEDYCGDAMDEGGDEEGQKRQNSVPQNNSFLEEDRGKTFRIALYLLAKNVEEYYLAGPNLNQEQFGLGMKRFLERNQIKTKEVLFEPTLRITAKAYGEVIEEQLPAFLPGAKTKALVSIKPKINDKIRDVIAYIEREDYGKTLLYCTTPAKAIEYSNKLVESIGSEDIYENYPDEFKNFISHIKKEYDVENFVEEWGLIRVLRNGFGMHHGKLPKYIQQEILEQFNNGVFRILFCTSTIVEGVNTDAQNMIILNPSKGRKKLTPFDIKNIKGRAGRYYHCFVGRVFYMSKELSEIENSTALALDFVTYSQKELNTIDLDNAGIEDLILPNMQRKQERDEMTSQFLLPQDVFIKNRTVSKENQEKLLQKLMEQGEYSKYYGLLSHPVIVEDFLKYRWIRKILGTFFEAGLIDERTRKKFFAVANSYYENG